MNGEPRPYEPPAEDRGLPVNEAGLVPFAVLLKGSGLLFKNSGGAMVFALTLGAVNVLEMYLVASIFQQNPGADVGLILGRPDFLALLFLSLLVLTPALNFSLSLVALKVWDGEQVTPADYLFGFFNLKTALWLYWCFAVFWFLPFLAIGMLPGLLPFLNQDSGWFAFLLFVFIWVKFIWPRARRIMTCLYDIAAFRRLEGAAGDRFWPEYTMVYRDLDDPDLRAVLNPFMWFVFGLHFFDELAGYLFPLESATPETLPYYFFSRLAVSVLFVWLTIAAAGFYRLNYRSTIAARAF